MIGARARIARLLFVAGVYEGYVQRIGNRTVALRPEATGIKEAHRVGHVGAGYHGALVQIGDTVLVNVLQEKVRDVVRPGVGPQKLPRVPVQCEDTARFTGGKNNIATLAWL